MEREKLALKERVNGHCLGDGGSNDEDDKKVNSRFRTSILCMGDLGFPVKRVKKIRQSRQQRCRFNLFFH